jgi:hypothetical protein
MIGRQVTHAAVAMHGRMGVWIMSESAEMPLYVGTRLGSKQDKEDDKSCRRPGGMPSVHSSSSRAVALTDWPTWYPTLSVKGRTKKDASASMSKVCSKGRRRAGRRQAWGGSRQHQPACTTYCCFLPVSGSGRCLVQCGRRNSLWKWWVNLPV